MIKYGMAVVGVLLVMGILWPVVSGVLGKKPNEATRLVEATERTNNKAESLNRSFTDVIPPAPVRETYRPPASALGTQAPGAQATGASGTPSPQDPNQEDPVPTPTPDPYEHPSEHAVRDAMEFLNRLQTEMEPTQTEYIQAVEQLQRAWTPRYERANDEFKRFARRIDHSDAMAQEYFLVQQNLTVLISQPEGTAAGGGHRRDGARGLPGLARPSLQNAGAGEADHAGPARHEHHHHQAEPQRPLRGTL